MTDKDNKKPKLGTKTKAAMRRELEQATAQFLQVGGEVDNVPRGATAWEPGQRPPPSRPLFTEPPSERTPVPEVVATIEARRESLKESRKPASKRGFKRSRKQVIYDDFGEPLRHVWVDD
ncbi:hypothetical protein R0135_04000 [Congregibacter variabilis]|uniref:Transcriptional regulator SutA RNAP-binding domain-containing protein n=1 Tax=Congregibacter variabilis TaxID=3081200 RepID=A0ABZ0I486_9GAMM|nr:hypothetical protein R0135_04000 [Congregibacter sp. IMCC43200]